jgi:hypothetical protein
LVAFVPVDFGWSYAESCIQTVTLLRFRAPLHLATTQLGKKRTPSWMLDFGKA